VIAVLVTVILTLLGVSYLLMAETENRIAENERRGAQALYAGESAARMVKRWFDRPYSSQNPINAPLAAIDRTQRMIDADGDPSTAPVAANGSAGSPYYKQNVDRDSNGVDDVFEKPYRDALVDTLLGTENGPDMRIDRTASTAAANFLDSLSAKLHPNYPSPAGGVKSRIVLIDIYAPPYINVAGAWTRYGMGTVKVISQIYQDLGGGTEQVLGERMIKAVLNETPYPGPFGPLHSCDNLSWNGDFTVYWGAATAVSTSDLTNNHAKIAASLARDIPAGARLDALYGYNDNPTFVNYKAAIEGENVEDPWFRYMSGGPLTDPMCSAPAADPQRCPFPGLPLGDEGWPNHDNNPDDGCHSNIYTSMPMVTCPEFDYEIWKTIATSGGSDVHYYVWTSGTSFKENGFGTAQTFESITDNQEGLFFFDTKDGSEPLDTDGDGVFDNLTPEIEINGGTWGVRGFVYLNADEFQASGVTGRAATFNAPGEPYQDFDQDGVFDAGENWINLQYPTTLGGNFVANAADTLQDDGTMGATAIRNRRGPDIASTAVLWGILYNNGYWNATGNARYYGSIVSKQGVGETGPSAGTPELYWDQSIVDNWPPDGWDLPRVVITRWETDL
jgi:hypothetical protein